MKKKSIGLSLCCFFVAVVCCTIVFSSCLMFSACHKKKSKGLATSGMLMACIGDSITQGCLPKGGNAKQPYPAVLKDLLDLKACDNFGISGSTVAVNYEGQSIICERLDKLTKKYDIISVFAGTNDYGIRMPVPLGTISDTQKDTYYGGLKFVAETLKSRFPNAFIFFITPYKRLTMNVPNKHGYVLKDIQTAIFEVAAMYDIPVLDFYTMGGFENEMTQSFSDGLHPTQDFLKNVTAPDIAEFVLDHLKK